MTRRGNILGCILDNVFETIRNKYSNNDDNILDFIVDNSKIVPDSRKRILKKALQNIWQKDYYCALHIIVGQIERVLKEIYEIKHISYTYLKDKETEEYTLTKLIASDSPLVNVLGENILFLLRFLLNEPSGGNIRNEIAHGLMEEKDANSGLCFYFICVFIKLLYSY